MSDKIKKFDKDTKLADIPSEAFEFNLPGGVGFAAEDDEGKNNLRLQLYDGGVYYHWYWGNMAFDLDGVKAGKKKLPMLYAHDTDCRIAVAASMDFEGHVIIEGPFLKRSQKAAEIKQDMEDGFVFESSLRFDSGTSVIERVGEGTTAEVNGRKLKGPGVIFRKWVLMEGSVCVFGALNNTKAQAFIVNNENSLGDIDMSEKDKTQMTVELFKTDHEDIYNQVFEKGKAEGQTDAQDRLKQITELCKNDHELAVTCFTEGKSDADVLKAYAEKLENKNKQLADDNDALKEKAQTLKDKNSDRNALNEFSDDVTNGKKKGNENLSEDEKLREEFKKSEHRAEYIKKCNNDEELAFQAFCKVKKADADGRNAVQGNEPKKK